MWLTIVVVVLVTALFFLVQSPSFQTWLAQKASHYLEEELKTVVKIDAVELHFFKTAELKGVFMEDLHKDTLISGGRIFVELSSFNFSGQKINIKNITLSNTTAKLSIPKNDSVMNFQFVINYFDSGKKEKDTSSAPWNVRFNDLTFDNVNFMFKNNNKDTKITEAINFNNLRANNISGKFSQIQFQKDTILVALSNLRFTEQSGFVLTNLSSNLKISEKGVYIEHLDIVTPGTVIRGYVRFKHDNWDAYSDFLNKVDMDVLLKPKSKVHLKDVASFTEELAGLNDTVKLSGKVKGTVADLSLMDFKLKLKTSTEFIGDLTIVGLPDFNNSYLHFDTKKLSSSYADLVQIPNYPFKENNLPGSKSGKLEIPIQLKSLGVINYNGKFDGLINDFNVYGNIRTALGSIIADVGIKTGTKPDDLAYHGKIKTINFNIGSLVGVKGLYNLNSDLKLKGSGVTLAKINSSMQGSIKTLNFNGYEYNNIKVDGTFTNKSFNGVLVSTDPNADFDFNGNIRFTNKVPEMDFISTVNKLNLKKLNFSKTPAEFSTQILINLKGDGLNNLSGDINFDNTLFKDSLKTYKISTFDLLLKQETIDKSIKLTSNYFNVDVDGRFNLTDLPMAFKQTLHDYYPTFVQANKGKVIYKDAFKYKITVKKFDVIKELFVPSLMISPGTQIAGDFDAGNNLINFNLKSSLIEAAGIKFKDNAIESYSKNKKINLVFKGAYIQLADSLRLNNYFMYFVSKDLDTKYNLEWNDKKTPNNSGKFNGTVSFADNKALFKYNELSVKVRDSTWKLTTSNPTLIDSAGNITINPLKFENIDQSIYISGTLSEKNTDSLNFITTHLLLDQFNPFLENYKLKLNGELNGRIKLQNTDKHITLNSMLDFTKFKFNDNLIGELHLKSDYITQEQRLQLDGYTSLGLTNEFGGMVKNLSFKGNYYLVKKEESIDIDFKASPLNLKLINPLMEGILTVKQGFVNGGGKIHGTADKILIEGELNLFKSEIKIDYTNVTYKMNGKIEIMPDQIRFSDILMDQIDPNDQMRNMKQKTVPQGTINGNLFHSNFKKLQLDYDISFRNMLALNTTERENKNFYGRVYCTGNVGLYGFMNDIHMEVKATTKKNSKFILPLDGPTEIAENDYIKFVKKDTLKVEEKKTLTGFNLDLNIIATPDATTQIIFDKISGDAINVYGNGDITMKINTLGKFEMYGDYIISGGDYNFSLQNVISKKFDIDPGSSIVWSGNPYNGDIDITASYRQRASIAPLINDVTGQHKSRTPAACKLIMKNTLMKPDISFELEFPSISDNVRSQISSVLADEAELNRQVFSFLLFRSFIPPVIYGTTGGGVTAGNAAASTGSELLSSRVNGVLDGLVGNFDKDLQVGVNYRPGSQNNSDEVLINVNRNFLDDKLSVDGNFGAGSSTGTSKNIIGDVNVEYKLSKDGRYKLKGFNRTNDNTQLMTSGGPYTQGLGFFFREEFNTWNDLYERYLQKLKRNKKPNEKP
ncbi:MAG: translocation/assembly module TamB domain-containing protein [Bacteroidota bacterium]|nr:translocation/assembly module TamB domain-containing protein [Bacteroidota bacterium]